MRESLRAAYEYVSYNHKRLDVDPDFKKDYDISVLATQMGVPKEGPSAGITILVALVSALTQRPVRNDVGMTGEITLLGKILPVGGVQEKMVAATEAGLRRVYIPEGNSRDVQRLPEELKEKLDIKMVKRVEDVLNDAILDYRMASTEDLEQAYSTSEPYILLKELEGTLREFIEAELSKTSKDWWKERIPPDVQEKAEERKEGNLTQWPWQEKEDLHPIYYIDFPDYVKIITRRNNWKDLFSKHFRNKQFISTKLRELEPIRNSIAHFRELRKTQMTKLRLYSKEISSCIRNRYIT